MHSIASGSILRYAVISCRLFLRSRSQRGALAALSSCIESLEARSTILVARCGLPRPSPHKGSNAQTSKLTSDAAGRFPVVRFNIHAEEPITAIAQFRDYSWRWRAPSRSLHDVGNFDRDFLCRWASFTDIEIAPPSFLSACVGKAFLHIHGVASYGMFPGA